MRPAFGGSPTITDEFGNTLTGTLNSYTWVGAKAKVTDTSSGLVLMGARVYNSITGTFLQRDPVYGGNTTTYGYPLDPILGYDLNGLFGWGHLFGVIGTIATVASLFGCGVCAVVAFGIAVAKTAMDLYDLKRADSRHKHAHLVDIGWDALDLISGGIGTKAFRMGRLADKVIANAGRGRAAAIAVARATRAKTWSKYLDYGSRIPSFISALHSGFNVRTGYWYSDIQPSITVRP